MENVMEWWQKQMQRQHNRNVDANGDVMYAKVTTDEQLETGRKQSALYSTIYEQLVERHRTVNGTPNKEKIIYTGRKQSALYSTIYEQLVERHRTVNGTPNKEKIIYTGRKQSALYSTIYEQLVERHRTGNGTPNKEKIIYTGKITSTQRWTPTPVQLQILERMFDQGNGTPNKEKIKEITDELRQHGHISETNVYNWFQNRRARSKRKLQDVTLGNTESEVENEVGCKDKKTIPEEYRSQHNVTTGAEKLCFQNPQVCSDLQYLNPDSNKPYSMFSSDGSLRSSRDLSPVPVSDEVLSNTITEHKPSGVMGDIYSDPLIHRRWTPTLEQLQILGRIFEEGKGKRITNKEKIKEITAELRQHGQISERNVYIWFQNKRARLKRKQHDVTDVAEGNSESEKKNEEYLITKKIKKNEEYQSQPNITTCDKQPKRKQHNVTDGNSESEIENEEYLITKKIKKNEEYQSQPNITTWDKQLCFQNPEEEDLQFLYSDSYVPDSIDSMFCYDDLCFDEVPSNTSM